MVNVRYGMFETNSSSTHTMCIVNDEEYKKLLNGELFIDYEDLVDKDTIIKGLVEVAQNNPDDMYEFCLDVCCMPIDDKKPEFTYEWFAALPSEDLNELAHEYLGAQDFDHYMNSGYYESYEDKYTTEHGDTVHIFGLFGRDV